MGKLLDLVGNKYGKLIVLELFGKAKSGHKLWLCRCACGNESVVYGIFLISGHTQSCGCLRKEKAVLLNTGKTVSDETRQRLSESHKGKHPSYETRKKMSKSKKGKKHPLYGVHKYGVESPNWKGGITPLLRRERQTLKYKEWRMSVFNRDNFTCQECGQYSGKLNAHHIKAFRTNRGLRLEISNGITLCYSCHKKHHSKKFK